MTPAITFVIPVQVSNDISEKLLVAYPDGTIILRTLEKELWRIIVDPFTQISAVGIDLDKQDDQYGLAFKTDTGNLIILDRISIKVVHDVITSAKDITGVNLGNNNDYILLNIEESDNNILSLFDPNTGSIIWSYSSTVPLVSWDIISVDSMSPGIDTHIITIDSQGTANLVEFPTTSNPVGDMSVTFTPPK